MRSCSSTAFVCTPSTSRRRRNSVMPRVTEEVLLGYQFAVTTRKVPDFDPKDGQPIFARDGEPKLVDQTFVVLMDPATGHKISIPLTDESRRELARQLSGGIVVATPAEVIH